jgi:hypothetical protein
MTTTAESLIRKARSKRQRKLFYSRARCFLMGALIATLAVLALMPHPAHPTKIWEDDPRWDCRTMGNRVCGPGNVQGAPVGIYDESGVLMATFDPKH